MEDLEDFELVSHDDAVLTLEEIDEIREWLHPTDYLAPSGEFRRHLSSLAPGTGLWICKTPEYQKWHDSSDHGSLWVKGVPGAGKSVIAASIIQHLQVTEDCTVLFFFFRNIVAANFLPRALLQDWLAQLLPHSPNLQFTLRSRLDSSLAECSDNDLFDIFLDGTSSLPRVYCVVDALDEMNTNNGHFLDNLNTIAQHRPDSLKLLITSRPKQYLQSALRDSSMVHISLQQQLVDVNIMIYLHHRFDKISHQNQALAHVKDQLLDMVTKRSGGLFLYSKLTMDQIEAILPTTDRLDIALLESFLPIGLEQTYTSLLLKYREGSGITADAQMLVLEAVTHASRPLRLNEVASLINTIYPDVTAPYGFEALVSTCCGPLIEILEDETLQVIHHSFTEFLGNNSTFNTQKAHKRMAIGCLRYLQSVWPVCKPQKPPTFTGDNDPIELLKHADKGFVEYQNSRLLHPFLAYAMNNWAYHASQHDVQDPDLFQAVLEFAHTENPALNKWVDLIMVPLSSCYWVPYIAEKGCQTRTRTTALHIAAYAGLSHLCEHLVQSDPTSISAPDKLFRNPLHWAAENGHSNVAAVLLQHKTHPDCSDIQQIKPIHLAAWRGHASIVKILCIAGVTPNSRTAGNNGPESSSLISQRWKGAYGWSGRETRVKPYDGTIEGGGCAIYYASKCGHIETILAMIPFCTAEMLEQLLCECCWFSKTDCVLAVLENSDVSADATYLGATALYYAVRRGNVRCVSALINQGADVCKMSNWWPGNVGAGRGTSRCRPQELRAPLHEAIHVWNKENGKECESIMRLLIDAGADIEQESGNGETPLLLCFGSRRACFIRGLMPRGPIMVLLGYLAAAADVKKTRPPCNDVALHLALQDYKDLEVILALLDHGSNPNRRDANGQTALHSAFNHNGRQVWGKDPEAALAMVQLLLDRGADPTIKDNSGHSAVHQAMLTGHEVFRMLLSKCHDESVKVECWFALTEIEESKFSRCVKILLAEGIDINTKREKDGRTLFLCCTDSIAKLHVLHSIGLDPHAVDASGHNALQIEFLFPRGYRSPSQYRRSVKDLIRNFGLDPRVANNNGDTLLHHYSRSNLNSGWLEVARWFISLGISVNATNNKGQTALHVFLEQMCQAKLKYKVRWPSRCLLDIGDEKNLINFEIRDGNGLAPLHLAAMVSEVQFDLIVAAGADLSFLTADGQNVIHIACRAHHASMVGMILIKYSGKTMINQKDRFGKTPLHYACNYRDHEAVALLLKHGATVHAQAEDGSTPLHACAMSEVNDRISRVGMRYWWDLAVETVAQMLLEAGSDPGAAENTSHRTPLEVALEAGNVKFVEVFTRDEQLFERSVRGKIYGVHDPKKYRIQMEAIRPSDDDYHDTYHEYFLKWPEETIQSTEYTADIINQQFNAADTFVSTSTLLKALMKPGYLEIARRVPRFILHHSTSEGLGQVEDGADTIYSALQLACQQATSNMEMVKLLVEVMNVDVNARNTRGDSVLHVLALAGQYWHVVAMRYLISKGADVNAINHDGQIPLHIVSLGPDVLEMGDGQSDQSLDVVRILLAHGADPNHLDHESRSPLAGACKLLWESLVPFNADIVKEMLCWGADPYSGVRTAFFEAVYSDNLEALQLLFEYDPNLSPDSVDESGQNSWRLRLKGAAQPLRRQYALLVSAFLNNDHLRKDTTPRVFCELINRGANLYVSLNEDETLIHLLFQLAPYDTIDILLREPFVGMIDFNRRDQHDRTVLMAACNWRGRIIESRPQYGMEREPSKAPGPPLRILDSQQSANPNLIDKEGKTPLHHLLSNPNMPESLLLDFASHPLVAPTLLIKDNLGFSPFHYASRFHRFKACSFLISKGANILEPDPKGMTVLHHIAAHCISSNLIEESLPLWNEFLQAGGDINLPDKNGNTPLMTYLSSNPQVVRKSSPLYFRWFYPSGMAAETNDNGVKIIPAHAMFYSKFFGREGVDIHTRNNEGETVLHAIAWRYERNRTADWLKGFYSGERENMQEEMERYDVALVEMMLRKGVGSLVEDGKGRTVGDVASVCGRVEILRVLRWQRG